MGYREIGGISTNELFPVRKVLERVPVRKVLERVPVRKVFEKSWCERYSKSPGAKGG